MMTPHSEHRAAPAVVSTVDNLRETVARARTAGRTIALVPTMGALHAGHASLIIAAAGTGAYTVVSIYVNPTQFGPTEDLGAYPRTPQTDRAAAGEAGAELIFAPSDEEMYPPGDQTRVRPGPLAETMCGRFRPGHFEGVCTVVSKLFHMVQPDVAYFGQKDAQQALVIRRMVADLHMPIRIEVCPIVREPDGLAISSRNAYLGAAEREQALCLYRALCAGRDMLVAGQRSVQPVIEEMEQTIAEAASAGPGSVAADYLTVVDAETLDAVHEPAGRLLVAGAVRISGTRLIDNLIVDLAAAAD